MSLKKREAVFAVLEPFHTDLLTGLSLQGYSGDGQPSSGGPWLLELSQHRLSISVDLLALGLSAIFLLTAILRKLGKELRTFWNHAGGTRIVKEDDQGTSKRSLHKASFSTLPSSSLSGTCFLSHSLPRCFLLDELAPSQQEGQ